MISSTQQGLLFLFFFFFSFFFFFLFFLFSYLNPTTTLLHYTFLQLLDSSSRLFCSPFLLLLLRFFYTLNRRIEIFGRAPSPLSFPSFFLKLVTFFSSPFPVISG